MSAKDRATNKEQKIRIEASSGISDAEIERMVKDAEAHAGEDKERREQVGALSSAPERENLGGVSAPLAPKRSLYSLSDSTRAAVLYIATHLQPECESGIRVLGKHTPTTKFIPPFVAYAQ